MRSSTDHQLFSSSVDIRPSQALFVCGFEGAPRPLQRFLEEPSLPGLKLSEYILKLGRQGQVAGFEFALHEKHHSQAGIV